MKLGVFSPFDLLTTGDPARARAWLEHVDAAGLDHVGVGDHVSFIAGAGHDGLVAATAIAALHPRLAVYTGIYLLPLRHPVPVARQLVSISQLAPGRLTFGVGIGGEDRHEVEVCGVDPRTRGRRMDECLAVLRALLTGEPIDFQGEFFALERALIVPPPPEPIPIVVGGRSDAALRRAGRHGDGWLGIWNSPRRFGEALELVAAAASEAGRADPPRRHAMQVWCGFATDRPRARSRLAPAMQAFYGIPFERFERYSPYGTPAEVAEFLQAYREAGCETFNLIPQAGDPQEAIAGAAEVKRLLS